ncbi:MAG: 50S ribosomal protein L6 [Candidatus Niyogibacteria bacterium]|nr:MAG: 50S ribosomal protein L6 [Candidatus Niyogibacteria bacterium]
MSRLAKKPIIIPQGVSVEFSGGELKVKGPKGELNRKVPAFLDFDVSAGEVYIKPKLNTKDISAFLGTFVRHLNNMIDGVTKGFEKKLELEGVGFRAEVRGNDLVLNLGFSHPITVSPPKGVSFSVEKNTIIVSGPDKETVGNLAATIRSHKKPEPYKGKGIRYSGEIIRRKAGKKVAASA